MYVFGSTPAGCCYCRPLFSTVSRTGPRPGQLICSFLTTLALISQNDGSTSTSRLQCNVHAANDPVEGHLTLVYRVATRLKGKLRLCCVEPQRIAAATISSATVRPSSSSSESKCHLHSYSTCSCTFLQLDILRSHAVAAY